MLGHVVVILRELRRDTVIGAYHKGTTSFRGLLQRDTFGGAYHGGTTPWRGLLRRDYLLQRTTTEGQTLEWTTMEGYTP